MGGREKGKEKPFWARGKREVSGGVGRHPGGGGERIRGGVGGFHGGVGGAWGGPGGFERAKNFWGPPPRARGRGEATDFWGGGDPGAQKGGEKGEKKDKKRKKGGFPDLKIFSEMKMKFANLKT